MLVVSKAAGTCVTSTSKYASAHAPAAMDGIVIEANDPGRRLMLGFAESHDQTTDTPAVAALLQMRAPTGKRFGPVAGLLLSSPITFQVIGATVRAALAPVASRPKPREAKAIVKTLARRCSSRRLTPVVFGRGLIEFLPW